MASRSQEKLSLSLALFLCFPLSNGLTMIRFEASDSGRALAGGEQPTEPGCYVMMPSGCPAAASASRKDLQEFAASLDTSAWKRDEWGEANAKAGVSQQACEVKRKAQYDTWCDTTDATLLFVPGMAPKAPSKPGCYIWMPSGCPKQKFHAKTLWRGTPDKSQASCQSEAKRRHDLWCGTSDASTLWIHRAPKAPKEPGCYVWMPTGCGLHGFHVQKQWKRDTWGEENAKAAQDREVCEEGRKRHYNRWCGETNARMLFVDSAQNQTNQEEGVESEEVVTEEASPNDQSASTRRYE